MPIRNENRPSLLIGPASALGAYVLWGSSSLYWHLFPSVPSSELLSYRVLMSCVILTLLLTITGGLGKTYRAAWSRKSLLIYSCSGLSIATNWTVFMWGAIHGHVIETGIGYLIAPLINVAFGAIILKERLSIAKLAGVALMAAGLVLLISSSGELTAWIYIVIGLSFGSYSLFRKLGPLGAIQGLAVETSLLTVAVFVGFLCGGVQLDYPMVATSDQVSLLALGGIVSVVPLWLFSVANRALKLATLGFFQYALPTTQFALAIFYYHQMPSTSTVVSLALIWFALGIVVLESIFVRRRPAPIAITQIQSGGSR